MQWTAETFTAIFAGVTLLLYFSATLVGAIIAIFKKIDNAQKAILEDVNRKHEENRIRVDALQTLVIRHDTILSPEFSNGKFRAHGSN
jgi:hypothetical protein